MASTVSLEGLDDVIAELKRRGLNVTAGLETICRAGAQVVLDDAADRAPGSIGERLLMKTVQKRKTAVTVAVGPGKRDLVARLLEYGVGPHDIGAGSKKRRRGKKRRVLYFDGRFATRVHHPGMRAQPYLRPAFDYNQGKAQDAMGNETERLIEG